MNDRRKGDRRVSPAVSEFALSERGELLARIEEQAREIDRLSAGGAKEYWRGRCMDAEMALKARPSGVVGERTAFDMEAIHQAAFEMGGNESGNYTLEPDELEFLVNQASAAQPDHSAQSGVPDVSAMARVLADRCADACNVDRDDYWKEYGQDCIEDVRVMLAASPHAKKEKDDE